MPQPWVLPGTGLTAVLIGGTDDDFFRRAARSLDKLNRTVAGNALLTALANRRAGVPALNVTIHLTAANNQCAGIPRTIAGAANSDGRTLLSQALIDGLGNIPVEIQGCLNAMAHPGNAGHAWLADAVNMTPIYNIVGMPPLPQSVIRLTANDVANWINGVTIYPAPIAAAQRDNLTLLLLTVLWPGSSMRPGNGLHSRVDWNPTRRQITLTNGVVLRGSKTVSLAHELTHALYNGDGRQLGNENGHFSTVLFEYMCVGLGPWATEQCSENKYRAEWTRPTLELRPCY